MSPDSRWHGVQARRMGVLCSGAEALVFLSRTVKYYIAHSYEPRSTCCLRQGSITLEGSCKRNLFARWRSAKLIILEYGVCPCPRVPNDSSSRLIAFPPQSLRLLITHPPPNHQPPSIRERGGPPRRSEPLQLTRMAFSDFTDWLQTSPVPRLLLAGAAGILILQGIMTQWEQPSQGSSSASSKSAGAREAKDEREAR